MPRARPRSIASLQPPTIRHEPSMRGLELALALACALAALALAIGR